MSIEKVQREFKRLLREAPQGFPYDVDLVLDGDDSHYPHFRDFARADLTDPVVIRFSHKILTADVYRIRGLLLHELGHVLAWKGCNLPFIRALGVDHTERQADYAAYYFFGKRVYYDKDDVQSTLTGTTPRPAHLPA